MGRFHDATTRKSSINGSGVATAIPLDRHRYGAAVLQQLGDADKVKAKGHRDLVAVVGSLASVSAGEWVTAEGRWVQDKEFGLQFRADMLNSTAPTTKEGIEKYLGSGMVKGIGPVYAKKLVAGAIHSWRVKGYVGARGTPRFQSVRASGHVAVGNGVHDPA